MLNELLNRYIDQNPMLCIQCTHDGMDCIETNWMWAHDESLDMNEVHLFRCDKRYGNLSDEQKDFVRTCQSWVQEQLRYQLFLRILRDDDLQEKFVKFCREHCKSTVLQTVAEISRL